VARGSDRRRHRFSGSKSLLITNDLQPPAGLE
jgi:hypothetical protein